MANAQLQVPTAIGKHFWVVLATDSGPRLFVRFSSHHPRVRWWVTRERHQAYSFATEMDARRVASQFNQLGRKARVLAEPPKQAERSPRVPTVPAPPPHLRVWIDRIIMSGRASS